MGYTAFPDGITVESGAHVVGATGPTGPTGPEGPAGNPTVAGGVVTLDGTNPTPVATGLTSITAASVSLKQSAAPGDDPSWITCHWTGGTLNIYAWKNTGGTDPTLVASTDNTAEVTWVAFGS